MNERNPHQTDMEPLKNRPYISPLSLRDANAYRMGKSTSEAVGYQSLGNQGNKTKQHKMFKLGRVVHTEAPALGRMRL